MGPILFYMAPFVRVLLGRVVTAHNIQSLRPVRIVFVKSQYEIDNTKQISSFPINIFILFFHIYVRFLSKCVEFPSYLLF